MRCTSLFITGFLAVASSATDSLLETKDFNVTQALLGQGVDVSDLPVSADDVKRSDTGCAASCASLKILYGDAAVETRKEKAFKDFTSSYWSSNQAEVNPYCIFIPQRPSVSLSKDKKIVSIEPGNIWGPVYEQLTKSDVSVVGGRLYNIGVGGLTTGGGISFFSNIYGWACDNVESYEVVLANGVIVKASATTLPDLYWALRGGGNNFGLIVKFNLKTIPLPKGEMWGGSRVYTEDKFPEVTDALFNILKNSEKDPKAGIYIVWSYNEGNKLSIPAMYYAEPDASNATIWKDFNKIEAISDTTQNRVLAAWGKETMNDSPPGLREVYYVITTKLDHGILEYARDYFYKTVPTVADISGIVPVFVVQGITAPQLKHMQKNGGNALGIDPEGGPLLILQLCAMWNNQSDDDAIYSWMSDIFQVVTKEAKARGVNSDYVYMNYASQYQDVIASYGTSNKAKLKGIAKKYDPQQVFQQLQPGYFKLNGAPMPNSGYFSH
ncbi:Bifunctional solanapyrone synthase [Fusarium oxysporum f. sp. rapae]|uniref:Bifunctional solanapyrone synthase n=1 Tax=Fusarium oxysporum f. sp. rapae TaxID=485398 RepID=A0A8J5U109_FUSOX|nr:Bifunctional solanapyrone synthase [Fusarium oxysporum f. sp. rapae]